MSAVVASPFDITAAFSPPANCTSIHCCFMNVSVGVQFAGTGSRVPPMSTVRMMSHSCMPHGHAYSVSLIFLTHGVRPMNLATQWSASMRTPSGSCSMASLPATVVGLPAKVKVARASGAVPADVIFFSCESVERARSGREESDVLLC